MPDPAATVTTPAPPPVADPAPAAVTPDTSATDPVSTESATETKTTATRSVKRTTRTAVAKPAPVRSVSSRTVTTHASTGPAVPPQAAPPPAAEKSAVTPVVDLTAKPQAPAATAPSAKPSGMPNQNELIFGGGALALLALGGAAFAATRRRRRVEEEWVDEPVIEPQQLTATAPPQPQHDPIVHREESAMIAPSAFAWGGAQPAAASVEADSGDDRRPGETWVERAYRGPTPGNPSVSLRNRLRRAAFFDKREREVAAGTAAPVEMDAGLPSAMIEEQERELA